VILITPIRLWGFLQALKQFTIFNQILILNKFAFSLISLFLLIQTSFAQSNRFSGWALSANTVKINPKWSFIFDTQLRSTDKWKQAETFIFRPGLAYNTSGGWQLSLGVAWVENWRKISGVRDGISDNRVWQQLVKIHGLSGGQLQHRLRMEERFLHDLEVSGSNIIKKNNYFNARFRYFNRYIKPFGKQSRFVSGPYWAIQNEFFFNITGLSYSHGKFFDQSRTYAGLGHRISTAADVEVGWMTQYALGRNGNHFVNNILQLSSFLRL
jgi:hypothetical protein